MLELIHFMEATKMRPTIAIYNVDTGNTEIREMNDEEFAQYEIERKQSEAIAKAEAKAQAEKELARQSALEKLAAFGLTEAEIKALVG